MFLFYHKGEPWTNPTFRKAHHIIPMTEDEIRACPWNLLNEGSCMKHRLCMNFTHVERDVIAMSQADQARFNAWRRRDFPREAGPSPVIYLENARPITSMAMCMALHPRLGQDSPLKVLSADLMKLVCNTKFT